VNPTLWIGAALLALVPATASAAGDPARGERLHQVCENCHRTELYVPPRRRVTSLKALRQVVQKYGDYYNPRLSKQDVEDLVAWLNRDFYKFPSSR